VPVPASDLDERTLRRAFGCFPSGVSALCALNDGVPCGMAASSFTSVSLNPPLVSVAIGHSSTTWPKLAERPAVGVSILAERHTTECRLLSSQTDDRFAGVDWEATASGAVFNRGAALWLECQLLQRLAAGDHDIVLFGVNWLKAHSGVAPLIFHGSTFCRLTKNP
jgi:flavin reductase (DIM6/NTAB) family NADH-FMN oxidoreductase RutF